MKVAPTLTDPEASLAAKIDFAATTAKAVAEGDVNTVLKQFLPSYADTFLAATTMGWSTALASCSIVAMVMSASSVVVLISSIVSLMQVPIVCIQRYNLLQLEPVRLANNKLRADANELTTTNQELKQQSRYLNYQARRLETLTEELNQTVKERGFGDVDTFSKLVKENSQTLKVMNGLIKEQIMHQVMTILCHADRDHSFHIDPHEVDELLARVKSIPGVEYVNEDRIRQFFVKASITTGDDAKHNLANLMDLIGALQKDKRQKVVRFSSQSLIFSKRD